MQDKFDYFKQIQQGMEGMRNETWECVLAHIPMRSTQALLQQHGQLLAINDKQARIRLSSEPLRKLALGKLSDIETGFRKTFGATIEIAQYISGSPLK